MAKGGEVDEEGNAAAAAAAAAPWGKDEGRVGCADDAGGPVADCRGWSEGSRSGSGCWRWSTESRESPGTRWSSDTRPKVSRGYGPALGEEQSGLEQSIQHRYRWTVEEIQASMACRLWPACGWPERAEAWVRYAPRAQKPSCTGPPDHA